jgi:microcystin-dependent protein
MGTPFLGELRLAAFANAPNGWAHCNGQLLPINQNQALFSLLGTMYGGDGQTTFALPNLRGRVPIHHGSINQGTVGGQEAHTLAQNEMPAHLHFLSARTVNADTDIATGNMLGSFNNGYRAVSNLTTLIPSTIANVGGSQPHENRQPFLTLTWMIALQGVFPSRN